ncbi:MAG: nitrous oxide reductase accessory protein NosL, partial [Bacteroidetes bacterium]|nr:nitrous oxide reductase accessory protein NosL [Bacteroidota bacterium]
KRFAAEILTSKGKAYKFDDMGCLLKYMSENNLPNSDAKIFVANYSNPTASFLDANTAIYIHSEALKTPMNGDYAAFSDEKNAVIPGDNSHGGLLKWQDLK